MSGFVGWLDDIGGPAMLGPLAVLVLFPVALLVGSLRSVVDRPGADRRAGHRDRLGLVDGIAGAVSGCAFGYLVVPWGAVPPLLWSACLTATVLGAALGGTRWTRLPTVASGSRTVRLLTTGAAVAFATALVVAAVVLINRPS